LIQKLFTHTNVGGEHAPWFIIAAVLLLAGIQLIGVGLLGELQVRHFFAQSQRTPYTVDRIVRMKPIEAEMHD
ncbi:MAG: glycosyltransferase, partial [Bryocella sp.]